MLSVEYPYYRASAQHWSRDLARIKSLGIRAVSFYIPWSFHAQSEDVFDFHGTTHPQANLTAFLEQVSSNDLEPIVKVGPYVHAELRYGGLPEGLVGASSPLQSRARTIRSQDRLLPDLCDATFKEGWSRWFDRVFNYLGTTHIGTAGLHVQLGNEGSVGEFSLFLDDGSFFERCIAPAYEALLETAPKDIAPFFNLSIPEVHVDSVPWVEWERRVSLMHDTFPDVPLTRTEWAGNPLVDYAALQRIIRCAEIGLTDVGEANWGYTWRSPLWGEPGNALGNFLLAWALGARRYNIYSAFQTCHIPNSLRMEPAFLCEHEGQPVDHEGWYPHAAPLREGASHVNPLIFDLLRVLEISDHDPAFSPQACASFRESVDRQASTDFHAIARRESDEATVIPFTRSGKARNFAINPESEFANLPERFSSLGVAQLPPKSYRLL